MISSIPQNTNAPGLRYDKILFALSAVFLIIIGTTILQDLVEAHIKGYAFYFSESLLFKTIWVMFIPILAIVYQITQHGNSESLRKTLLIFTGAVAAHFLLAPFIAFIFSILFFQGRYDLFKFFSYTLANDFYKLMVVYGGFVFSRKFFQQSWGLGLKVNEPTVLKQIVINNGKDNTIVAVEDILYITAATPYIFIHLKNRKALHSETLKSICHQLDSNMFVRVHKCTVVNVLKVASFRSRLNGDYDLSLLNGGVIRLSRTYAPNFKRIFKRGHRDTI